MNHCFARRRKRYFALSEITCSYWNLAGGFSAYPALHGKGGLPSWQRPRFRCFIGSPSCPIFIRRQVRDVEEPVQTWQV
jgi:hypothetical protein